MRSLIVILLLLPAFAWSGYSQQAASIRGLEEAPELPASENLKVIPRTVLFVPNLILKGAFYPIVTGTELIEEHAVLAHIEDFLFNDERSLGVLPILSYSSSDGWAAGAKLLSLKTFGDWGRVAQLKLRYAEEENHTYELALSDQRIFNRPFYYEIKLRREADPSQRFEGIGFNEEIDSEEVVGETLVDPRQFNGESRYSQRRDMVYLSGGYRFADNEGRALQTGLILIHSRRTVGEKANGLGDDPSIGQVYDTSSLVGFNETVETGEVYWQSRYESLFHPGQPSSGWTTELFGGGSPFSDRFKYWHYGAELTNYFHLFRGNRVLLARLAVEAVDGPSEQIPFASLIQLGGPGRLRGLSKDSFRDEKMGLATLEYHYPVHHNVLGQVFVDAGTLGKEFGELGEKWKAGYGFGFLVGSKSDLKFQIDISIEGDDLEFYFSTDVTRAFSKWSEKL